MCQVWGSVRRGGPGLGAQPKGLDCQAEEWREAEGEDEGATEGLVDEAGSAHGKGEHRSACASSREGVLPYAGPGWGLAGTGTGCSRGGTEVQRPGRCPVSCREGAPGSEDQASVLGEQGFLGGKRPFLGMSPEAAGRARGTQTPHSHLHNTLMRPHTLQAHPGAERSVSRPFSSSDKRSTACWAWMGVLRGLPACFLPSQLRNQKEASQSRSQEPQVPSSSKHRR